MKSNLVIQFGGKDDVNEADLIKTAQEAWKNAGNKVSDIKDLKLYAQPDNSVVYYVINEDFKGNFNI